MDRCREIRHIAIDPAGEYPNVRVTLSIAQRRNGTERIVAAYGWIHWPTRREPDGSSMCFDDDQVVVDFDSAGCAVGVEVLTFTTSVLTELRGFAETQGVVGWTADAVMEAWSRHERTFRNAG